MSDPLDMNNYRLEKLPKMQKSGFEIWMARLGGPLAITGSDISASSTASPLNPCRERPWHG